jgi:hypothetical protein
MGHIDFEVIMLKGNCMAGDVRITNEAEAGWVDIRQASVQWSGSKGKSEPIVHPRRANFALETGEL